MKIVYISGIGRSGSTPLDLIISSNPKIFNASELKKFKEVLKGELKNPTSTLINDYKEVRNYQKRI